MSDKARVAHVLNPEERQVIVRFGAEVDRLWFTPVVGGPTILTIKNHFDWSEAGPGKPPRFLGRTAEAPSDDDLAARQRQFRIFILAQEPTHFPTIRSLVSRSFYDAGVEDPRGVIKATKAAWSLPRLKRMGCPVPGQDLIDWWFNAELFHRDAEKQAKLDDLRASAGEQNLRIWLMLAFTFSHVVLTEFHTFLRDETDLYDGASQG